jgi:hypothetical protein
MAVHRKTYLVDVLALELGDELGETLLIGLDANGRKDGLDILSGWGGVTANSEEKVCCEVLHFDCSRGLVRTAVQICVVVCDADVQTYFWRKQEDQSI